MRRWELFLVAMISPGLLGVFSTAQAESEAMAMPGDNRLVVFRFDPNNTFTIYAIPGVPTDIQLSPDEKIMGLALGDTVQWVIEELPGHLFVKPIRADLFTAGTLVTDRRVYQLAFKSTTVRGRWYQKVSWSYPDSLVLRNVQTGNEKMESHSDELSPERLDPAALNFSYDIVGEGDFKPMAVFDDGRFTWLRVKSPQALPALFMVDGEGTQLVNYIIKGDYFVVQRLMVEVLLKLGQSEVRVINRRLAKKPGKREGEDSASALFQ